MLFETSNLTKTAPSYIANPLLRVGLVPGLTVLYHPCLSRIGDRVVLPELNASRSVALGRNTPDFAAPGRQAQRRLGDPRLSRQAIRLIGDGAGGVRIERAASSTPLEVKGRVYDDFCCSAEQLDRGLVFMLGRAVVLLLHRIDPLYPEQLAEYGMVGESAELLRVRRMIRQVAPLDISVLLRGESGTGKELAAQAIHREGRAAGSRDNEAPFIAVNITALPASLASAELFGAARGAFTGAERTRQGLFASAAGGTLFLDEIGDASYDLQAMLLRVLESGEIQPLGGSRPHSVDTRIVAATDADLEERAARGEFRLSLLHRLASFPIRLPSLRERRDDIGRLLRHFLSHELRCLGAEHQLEAKDRPWLPAPLVAALADHDWPGNVRELRNLIRRLVIMYRDRDEVPPGCQILASAVRSSIRPAKRKQARRFPAEISESELIAALRSERFRLQATADRLAIPRSSLYRLIERSGVIRTAAELGDEEVRRALDRHDSVEQAAGFLQVSATGLRRRMQKIPN